MAKKFKRNRMQGSKQRKGTSSYIFDGLLAMARTLVNAKKDWGVEKMYEFAEATKQYAKSLEDIPSLGGYATAAGESITDLADYVNESEFDQILKDSSNFAKRHPVPMIIGGAIAGLAVTQILRSNEFSFKTGRPAKRPKQSKSTNRGRPASPRGANGQAHLST